MTHIPDLKNYLNRAVSDFQPGDYVRRQRDFGGNTPRWKGETLRVVRVLDDGRNLVLDRNPYTGQPSTMSRPSSRFERVPAPEPYRGQHRKTDDETRPYADCRSRYACTPQSCRAMDYTLYDAKHRGYYPGQEPDDFFWDFE